MDETPQKPSVLKQAASIAERLLNEPSFPKCDYHSLTVSDEKVSAAEFVQSIMKFLYPGKPATGVTAEQQDAIVEAIIADNTDVMDTRRLLSNVGSLLSEIKDPSNLEPGQPPITPRLRETARAVEAIRVQIDSIINDHKEKIEAFKPAADVKIVAWEVERMEKELKCFTQFSEGLYKLDGELCSIMDTMGIPFPARVEFKASKGFIRD